MDGINVFDLLNKQPILPHLSAVREYAPHIPGNMPTPEDPPAAIDVLKIIPAAGYPYEVAVSSTRNILIGWIYDPQFPNNRKWGYVVAENKKNGARYTLAGGRVEPLQDERESEEPALPAEEGLRTCAARETLEEVRIVMKESNFLLFGYRVLTDRETGNPAFIRNLPAVDAYLLALPPDYLHYSNGYRGETGEGTIFTFDECTRQVNKRLGERPILPATQVIGIAMAIIYAEEILMGVLPEEVKMVIRRDVVAARQYVERSQWSSSFYLLVQEKRWVL